MNTVFDFRFLKFGLVGFSGMLLDFGITWICKESLRINKYIANTAGFTTAVISNFILNRNWTFEQQGQNLTNQFAKFLLVSLCGLALNNLLLYLFINKTKQNFYFLKLLVIGLVFFWNYLLNLLFTFN